MKQLAFNLAGQFPAGFWNRLGGMSAAFPYYHMVNDESVPHVSPLYSFPSVRKFREDLDFFLSIAKPISVDDLTASLESDGRAPDRSFLLTFDDGFREMHDVVLPILLEKGVPAAFFVTSASVDNRALIHHQKIALLLQHRQETPNFADRAVREKMVEHGLTVSDVDRALRQIPWTKRRLVDELATICGLDFERYLRERRPYLSLNQLRTMQARGMHIGAHSVDHPRYADVSLAEQLRQTQESVEYVARTLGDGLRAFAFPHTDDGVSAEFFRIVRERKLMKLAFGTGAPLQDRNPWNVQRFSMEKTRLNANAVAARNFFRSTKLRLLHRHVLQRSELPA